MQLHQVMVHGGLVPLLHVDGSDYTSLTPPGWLKTSVEVNYRQIVMRTSSNPRSFPLPQNGARLMSGSTIIGSTIRSDIIAKQQTEPGTGTVWSPADQRVVSGYNAYRNVHAVKGHAELSEDGNVLVTYNVWGKKRCTPQAHPVTCPAAEEVDLYYTAYEAGVGAGNNTLPPVPSAQSNAVSSLRSLKFPVKYVHPWCNLESPAVCPPAP